MKHLRLSEIAEIKFCVVSPGRTKTQETPTMWLQCANFLRNFNNTKAVLVLYEDQEGRETCIGQRFPITAPFLSFSKLALQQSPVVLVRMFLAEYQDIQPKLSSKILASPL